MMPTHTDHESGAFIEATERIEAEPRVYGRTPGKILPGQNAPDALVVDTLPEPTSEWTYAEELAETLFGVSFGLGQRFPGKYLSRLYTLAKNGYLESVVLYPHHKRYYRILDIEKCRAEVAIRYLTGKYKHRGA